GESRACDDHVKTFFTLVGAKIILRQPRPAVGEHQAYVHSHQRATAPEHKAHEPTNGAVALDSFAIINPNQREILHIVKYFEQCNAHEHTGDNVVAIPPKRNGCDQKH